MGRAWMPLYVADYLRDTRDLAAEKPAPVKPANQWSRQELDALFARRIAGPGDAGPEAPAPILIETTSNKQTGG